MDQTALTTAKLLSSLGGNGLDYVFKRLILKIAYFVNQYPKVSHSFIRREILAMERQGFEVQRIALRGWNESLPDAEDRQEQEKTQYVLRTGLRGLLIPLLLRLLRSPLKMYAACCLAIRI